MKILYVIKTLGNWENIAFLFYFVADEILVIPALDFWPVL